MNNSESMENRKKLSAVSLVPFFLITFVIAWGVLGLYVFYNEGMTKVFGQLSGTHPLFFLAVWAPAIAAFAVITIKQGFSGLKRFIARIKIFKCSVSWCLFIFVAIPLVFYVGAAIKGTLFTEPFPISGGILSILTALILSVIMGPIEEFGWRGFALPLMQRHIAPLWAGIILGFIWGIWHLPAFLISGTQQSAWSFAPFFLGTIAISVLATALFNASKGSILLAAILHFQFMNPIWPDAQPYDSYLLIVVTAVVVWLNRKTMFTRSGSITTVVSESDLNNG
ncbi:MAG: CPBP family intramembrane metalloprotease [Candidatus Cloacimonetes bacterium]|nr:CPBP family intramembrane metalloprotease [Candidatus Cloacimonadota bacterium]